MVDVREELGLRNTAPNMKRSEWLVSMTHHYVRRQTVFLQFHIHNSKTNAKNLYGAPNFINILFAPNFKSENVCL